MNAEKYGLERIYFGGCFIRGHPATIATLSYAIRFWSKGTKRALFLRHEGFLCVLRPVAGSITPTEITHPSVVVRLAPGSKISMGTVIWTGEAEPHNVLRTGAQDIPTVLIVLQPNST